MCMCVSVCVVSYSQMSSAIFTHTHTPACQNKAEAVTKLQLRLKKTRTSETVQSRYLVEKWISSTTVPSIPLKNQELEELHLSSLYQEQWSEKTWARTIRRSPLGKKKTKKKNPNNNRSGKYYTVNLNNWWGKFENSKRGHSERQALSTGSPLW